MYTLPLNAAGERKPIAAYHSTSQTQGPRLSPDDKFLSYASNQSGRIEVYIRPFDPSASADAPPSWDDITAKLTALVGHEAALELATQCRAVAGTTPVGGVLSIRERLRDATNSAARHATSGGDQRRKVV